MPVSAQKNNHYSITKEKIIETARHLFSEFSYLGVSMDDIAKRLNITKTALYYHFTGKAEIYKKVVEKTFNDLELSITKIINDKDASCKQQLRNLINNYLDFGFQEQNLIRSFISKKTSPLNSQIREHIIKSRKKIIDLIKPVVKEVQVKKKLPRGVDSQSLAFLLAETMDGIILEYSLLNKKMDSKRISNQIISILF